MDTARHAISVFFFQAEDGIRDDLVTGVQTCALPISAPTPKSAPTFAPPANAKRPIREPIMKRAVHIAASFSRATFSLGRGSDRSTSIEPRSSSPRSIRLPTRSGQIALRKAKKPILEVA